MSRPVIDPSTLVSGQEAWDALLRDIIAAIATQPLPIKRYANFAALPTASNYDDCIAAVEDTHDIYISTGSAWKKITREA